MSPSRLKLEHRQAWLLPACLGLKSRGASFHLMQFGAEGGIDLIADYLERPPLVSPKAEPLPGPEGYRDSPYPVLSRTGLIDGPLPARGPLSPEGELFAALRREPSGPRLFSCPLMEMPSSAAGRLSPRSHEGVLAFNCAFTELLDDACYAEFRSGVASWLAQWGELGFWAELERPRVRTGKEKSFRELTVHRMTGAELQSAVLGRVGLEAGPFEVGQGWNFLQPLTPVQPQRITIEEPPRRDLRPR